MKLECKQSQKQLIVICSHHLWNPRRGDIKISQLSALFQETNTMAANSPNIQIILAGDFNVIPQSLVYNFIVNGSVRPPKKLDLMYWSGQIKQRRPTLYESVDGDSYSHPFLFESAYAPHFHVKDGIPFASSFHDNGKALVDFIFHGALAGTTSRLSCLRYLAPPVDQKCPTIMKQATIFISQLISSSFKKIFILNLFIG